MNEQPAQDILTVYTRHGWRLRRALLRPETIANLKAGLQAMFADAQIIESEFEAFWFSRPSHQGREAWELRLISENPYALFEAFEADESEEDREDARRDMEARMREQAAPG